MPNDPITVRRATQADHETVASLVLRLLTELYDAEKYGYRPDTLGPTARELLREGSGCWTFLAHAADGTPVGVLTLNECAAMYAFGRFGEISELYVTPEHRSAGIGVRLVDAAVEFGRRRGWLLIEVGAPAVPQWQRTVDFYLRCGFAEIGPRLTLYLSSADASPTP